MPKAARRSLPKHEQAVPLRRAAEEQDDDDVMLDVDAAADDAAMDDLDEPADDDVGAEETPAEQASSGPAKPVTKKAKKKGKRAALMQREQYCILREALAIVLEADLPGVHFRHNLHLQKIAGLVESSIPVSPYSKSHNRRLKRKAKDSMGLSGVTAALDDAVPELVAEEPAARVQIPTAPSSATAKNVKAAKTASATSKPKTAPGKIGEDTVRKNMSSKQREKMLQQERERMPAILAHKSFSANPFETIRLHAQNTLVPLEKSRRPNH